MEAQRDELTNQPTDQEEEEEESAVPGRWMITRKTKRRKKLSIGHLWICTEGHLDTCVCVPVCRYRILIVIHRELTVT